VARNGVETPRGTGCAGVGKEKGEKTTGEKIVIFRKKEAERKGARSLKE